MRKIPKPWSWIVRAIPVVALLGYLWFVLTIFLDPCFWIVRENAFLPSVTDRWWRHDVCDRSIPVEVIVTKEGRYSFGEFTCSGELLAQMLHKIKEDSGGAVPLVVKAYSNASWAHVKYALTAAKATGARGAKIAVRDSDGWPQHIFVCLADAPTNDVMKVHQSAGEVSINGFGVSLQNLSGFVHKMSRVDPMFPVIYTCDTNVSMQTFVSVLEPIASAFSRGSIYVLEESP